MELVDVVAVMGPCAAERTSYAKEYAETTGSAYVETARLLPAEEAPMRAARWARRTVTQGRVIVDLPAGALPSEVIGELTETEDVRLVGLVCVLDAMHLLTDLDVADARPPLPVRPSDAQAATLVEQIEYASTVVLCGWNDLSTPDLSATMALVSHLAPRARLRLHPGVADVPVPVEEKQFEPRQDGAGWMMLVNDEHDPHMTDPRITSVRYESVRPFHPGRLYRLLDQRIARDEFGSVVRSAGFCRLATRSRATALWRQVGRQISLDPVGLDASDTDDEDLLAVGQDLAFTGIDLDVLALGRALDDATLTDAEFALGPRAWERFADPFPAWRGALDPRE